MLTQQSVLGICSWFRCVYCNQDSQCPAGKYCKGKSNPFVVNECTPKKDNGGWCIRDAMCKSGKYISTMCLFILVRTLV